MSVWTILLKEVVKEAVVAAIRKEMGADGKVVEDIIQDSKAAAEKIVNTPETKINIRDHLTEIFRAILRIL